MSKFYSIVGRIYGNEGEPERLPADIEHRTREQLSSESQYEKILIQGLRYFDNVPLLEIKRMTPQEYDMRMKVARLKRIDKLADYATLTLLERKAKETKQIGDKTYLKNNTPIDIFDYEKEEKLVFTGLKIEKETYSRLTKIALNLRKYRNNKTGENNGREENVYS